MPKTDRELITILLKTRKISSKGIWFDAGVIWATDYKYWTDAWVTAMDMSALFKMMVIALTDREYALARIEFRKGFVYQKSRRATE